MTFSIKGALSSKILKINKLRDGLASSKGEISWKSSILEIKKHWRERSKISTVLLRSPQNLRLVQQQHLWRTGEIIRNVKSLPMISITQIFRVS